jgi:hypothetical protein
MSVSISDNQVCLDILELLYKRVSDDPASSGVDRAIIQATLKIPENQMNTNMSYLAEKTLVTLSGFIGSRWTFAKITGDGIDVIENKERYAEKYPFTQAVTSHILDDGQEKVLQKMQPQVSLSQQVTDAFKQASDQVLGAKISNGDKGKIQKQLRDLEKELLKTKKADLGAIQEDWEWLKKNANWLSPSLASVMLEGIRVALDLPISSKP